MFQAISDIPRILMLPVDIHQRVRAQSYSWRQLLLAIGTLTVMATSFGALHLRDVLLPGGGQDPVRIYLSSLFQVTPFMVMSLVFLVVIGTEITAMASQRFGFEIDKAEVCAAFCFSTTPMVVRSLMTGLVAAFGLGTGFTTAPWVLVDPTPLWSSAIMWLAIGEDTVPRPIRIALVSLPSLLGYGTLLGIGLLV